MVVGLEILADRVQNTCILQMCDKILQKSLFERLRGASGGGAGSPIITGGSGAGGPLITGRSGAGGPLITGGSGAGGPLITGGSGWSINNRWEWRWWSINNRSGEDGPGTGLEIQVFTGGKSLIAIILKLCRKEPLIENARCLVHFTITQANLVGAPRGKTLAPKAVPEPSASTSSGAVGGNIPVPDPSTTPDFVPLGNKSNDIESRLKDMENKMTSFSNKSAESQVGESLAHVRILASRPNLTPSHVLLAAIESLVTVATKYGHKEAEFSLRLILTAKSSRILRISVI
ncbi:unnamed protein product [Mytilus coruscus]|uniref:Uncharacterized protein n=1 Tax=Mytilus coruscus TaxID=42192 RepID=A0A6J8BRV7_MYTCO|nr:unnamed protein product [Mytilus coruscus]